MKYIRLKKKVDNQALRNCVLNFENKELSSYVFETCCQQLNLDGYELDARFLFYVLKDEDLKLLGSIYLNVLENSEKERYESLSKQNTDGFDLKEVVCWFSEDLKKDYSKYHIVFFIFSQKKNEAKKKENILQKMLQIPRFGLFCDGLGFSNYEKVFLLLNLANKEWDWLFPQVKTEEYKALIFGSFFPANERPTTELLRKMNDKFIRFGLFSDPWEPKEHLFSYMCGKNLSCNITRCLPNAEQDVYDYKDIEIENQKHLEIIRKQVCEYNKQRHGCYMTVSGTSDFRNRNFTGSWSNENALSFYEFKQQIYDIDFNEIAFYLYAFSTNLEAKNGFIYLGKEITDSLLKAETPDSVINIVNGAVTGVEHHKPILPSVLLKNIRVPVVLSFEKIDEEKKNILAMHGIDVLFSWEMKLTKETNYYSKAGKYFWSKKIPEKLMNVVCETCEKLKVEPEKWDEVARIMKNATMLSRNEAAELLKNKYGSKDLKGDNLRKNSCYSLEALNTTEPVEEIINALKNAEEYQNGEYDCDSGIRILQEGPSGTGKTAYVEQCAKAMNKPLKIVHASDILRSYVGETEKNIKETFEQAAKDKAILLIDEADSFLHARGDNINRHNDIKVNEFLVQMERYPGILFCNTNLPESLDKATDRRFHIKIGFKPLKKEGVAILCKTYFGTYSISEEQVNKISSAGDVTPGDFGVLNGRLRFMDKSKLNSEYITQELCKIVHGKNRSWEDKKVGFFA